MFGDYQNKVLEGRHYVCQYLGDPIFLDAAGLGFFVSPPSVALD